MGAHPQVALVDPCNGLTSGKMAAREFDSCLSDIYTLLMLETVNHEVERYWERYGSSNYYLLVIPNFP